jgi:hypothetical protein
LILGWGLWGRCQLGLFLGGQNPCRELGSQSLDLISQSTDLDKSCVSLADDFG